MGIVTTPPSPVPPAARVAGAAMALVGLSNAIFGVLALTTDLVRLTAGAAAALFVLGVLTAATAVPVWRGSRGAVTAALTIFGLLLVVQLFDTAAGSDTQSTAPRLIVLGLLVAFLTAAWIHLRRRTRRSSAPSA